MIAEIFGWIGTVLTSIALVPQSVKVLISRNTKDISLYMYIILMLSAVSWTVYGFLLSSINWQIIVTNLICLTLACLIFVLKLYNMIKKREK